MQVEKRKLLLHNVIQYARKVGVIQKMPFCILKLNKYMLFLAITGGPSSLGVSVFPLSGMPGANMLLLLSG